MAEWASDQDLFAYTMLPPTIHLTGDSPLGFSRRCNACATEEAMPAVLCIRSILFLSLYVLVCVEVEERKIEGEKTSKVARLIALRVIQCVASPGRSKTRVSYR